MKPRAQKITAALLLVFWGLQTPPVYAESARAESEVERSFAELIQNTKEAGSLLLNSEELDEAELTFPSKDPQTQARLRSAFTIMASSVPSGEEACEPVIFSRLQEALKAQGLIADPASVRQALLMLRKMNLMDDVVLLPLLASHSTWESLGYRAEEWIRKDSEGRTLQIDCPTDQFLRVISTVKEAKGPRAKRKDFRKRIEAMAKEQNDHGENRYLPVQIQWLKTLNANRYDKKTPFSLPNVVKQLDGAKDSAPSAHSEGDTPSPVLSKRKKKSGGLSNRLALYAKYDAFQIKLLSELFENFTHRITNSKSAVVLIEYKDGSPAENYILNDQEQYRMFAKMLHKDLVDLKIKRFFSGKNPTFDEVIVAAAETGAIRGDELEAAMGVEELWNPKVSFWQKAMNATKKYGSTSLLLIPPPISFWAALVLTLGETIVSKKLQKPGNADDRGISIF